MRGTVKYTVVQLTLPTGAKSPKVVRVSLPPVLVVRLTFHTLPEPSADTNADAISTIAWKEFEFEPCSVVDIRGRGSEPRETLVVVQDLRLPHGRRVKH